MARFKIRHKPTDLFVADCKSYNPPFFFLHTEGKTYLNLSGARAGLKRLAEENGWDNRYLNPTFEEALTDYEIVEIEERVIRVVPLMSAHMLKTYG